MLEVTGHELNELVLHVLNEVESTRSNGRLLYDEYGEVIMRPLNTIVQHPADDIRVVWKVHHEFLSFLHFLKACLVESGTEMEK